jgi:hypothetical protein
MPHSINGTGTRYYGKALPNPDGSYVVTEWVTFFALPLVPLGSRRVWFQNRDSKWWSNRVTDHYKVLKVPLHRPHVLKGLLATVSVVGFFAIGSYFNW